MQLEDISNIIRTDQYYGVMVQFGGQNAVNLAVPLEKEIKLRGLPTRILVPPRMRWILPRIATGSASCWTHCRSPVLPTARPIRKPKQRKKLRKSATRYLSGHPYVLGGRAMEIVHDTVELETYMKEAVRVSQHHPVPIDSVLKKRH